MKKFFKNFSQKLTHTTDYRIFIDESGEREHGNATSTYFVYAGCIVHLNDIPQIESEIDRLKNAYFGTSEIEFKSNWFRIPKERRKRYLYPHNLTETTFREMTREIYRIVLESPLTFVASVIDKKLMQDKYNNRLILPVDLPMN